MSKPGAVATSTIARIAGNIASGMGHFLQAQEDEVRVCNTALNMARYIAERAAHTADEIRVRDAAHELPEALEAMLETPNAGDSMAKASRAIAKAKGE